MAKKKILTPEEIEEQKQERIKEALESELKDIRSRFIPNNPTYFFEPGEEVIYGAHKKVIVREKLDDGKIYLVDIIYQTQKDVNNSGLRYLDWIQLRKKENWEEVEIFREKNGERIHYMQQSVHSLFTNVYDFGVDLNPSYQREHVWSLEDKVSLIDSIMKNIDIGKFVFIHREFKESKEKGTGLFEILDGKQRLTALCEFFEDRFTYKGKTFSQLHPYDKNQIIDYNVSVAELHIDSEEKRIEIFIKLNTAGRVMDKDHLEKVKKMLLK